MRALYFLPILAAFVLVAACTVPAMPGTQENLQLSQQAHFESNGYAFGASINNIRVIENNRTIVLTIAIQNTGNKGMSLSAMPVINDPIGQSYPGPAVFYSQVAPGYTSIQKGTISIPEGTLAQLSKGSTLKIRFQGTSPTPYEATWDVDMTNLPG